MEVEKSIFDNNKNEEVMLPGFRFHPTDEELVGFYLQRKVGKKPISVELITQIDIYKYDPWDLPKISTVGDKEGYYFCIRGRKYRNSIRPNRVTGSGFWKATGIDKPVYSVGKPHECIGLKKSLVYYRGSAGKGTKTDWMMHEFRLPPSQKNTTLSGVRKLIKKLKYISAEWKETPIKQNPSDSSSKTCSLESNKSNQYVIFTDSLIQQNNREPVIDPGDGRNQLFVEHQNSIAQAASMASYSSVWNVNNDEFFRDGNWDELRSVLESEPNIVLDVILKSGGCIGGREANLEDMNTREVVA
ncbi:hypothetical protein L1049_024356 [Liquidambar formosana]|uniref:NAC domain-containing protein n=1 Tax=Liquidambar formosana TaxID=63359 RepID=A0AAP0S1T3_LIQFO